MTEILLIDEGNNILRKEEKIKTHQEGFLHRAFSIFIFNEKQELLLQRRSKNKYHFPNLWSNTCCSHPILEIEEIKYEAEKRLLFEMNINTTIKKHSIIRYYAECKQTNLIENELDFIFFGFISSDLVLSPNQDEVSGFKWIDKKELMQDIKKNETKYTPWLQIIIEKSNILNINSQLNPLI